MAPPHVERSNQAAAVSHVPNPSRPILLHEAYAAGCGQGAAPRPRGTARNAGTTARDVFNPGTENAPSRLIFGRSVLRSTDRRPRPRASAAPSRERFRSTGGDAVNPHKPPPSETIFSGRPFPYAVRHSRLWQPHARVAPPSGRFRTSGTRRRVGGDGGGRDPVVADGMLACRPGSRGVAVVAPLYTLSGIPPLATRGPKRPTKTGHFFRARGRCNLRAPARAAAPRRPAAADRRRRQATFFEVVRWVTEVRVESPHSRRQELPPREPWPSEYMHSPIYLKQDPPLCNAWT